MENSQLINFTESLDKNFAVILLIDPDTGQIIYGNSSAIRFYGYTSQELQTKFIWDINVLSKDKAVEKIKKVILGEKSFFNFKHRLYNGRIKDIKAFNGPIVLDGKNYIFSIIHDITNEKLLEEEIKQIFETTDAMIWSWKPKTEEYIVSKGVEEVLGINNEQLSREPFSWIESIHSEDLDILMKWRDNLILGKISRCVFRFLTQDGQIKWIHNTGTPVSNSKGEVEKVNCISVDITEYKKAEQKIRETYSELDSIFNLTSDGMCLIGTNGIILKANDALARILGISVNEIVGKKCREILPGENCDTPLCSLRRAKEGEDSFRLETRKYKKDKSTVFCDIAIKAFKNHEDRLIGIFETIRDITEQKQAQEKIHYMAYHDLLTGLPNRNMFNENLQTAIEKSSKNKKSLAVMLIDLDRFKIINDTMGHSFGDSLLKKVSERLCVSIRKTDKISRYGGDEFIVLLEDINELETINCAERILTQFSKPFKVDEYEFYSTPSIGISLYPNDGDNVETLIKNADTAMYFAKQMGKNTFQFYNAILNTRNQRSMELETGLRRAIENSEFTLHYQPQIDINEDKIIGMEALIRWNHPKLGTISPLEFIPLAEETGLIIPIGKWVLENACKQNKIWQDKGYPPVKVSVNISVRQFSDIGFVEFVKSTLKKVNLNPQYLQLEVTESIMQRYNESSGFLKSLKSLGVLISLDDFGTGYSSLSVLNHLPIDSLKIDQSFVRNLDLNPRTKPLVKTIIGIGHNLNLKVIAEGVETKEQIDFLKDNKCSLIQGFYFSKPMSVEQAGVYIGNRHQVYENSR